MNILPTNTGDVARLTEADTITLVVRRIAERGDMPGFSKAVQSIMSAMAEASPQEADMAHAVLSDVALTQKVLRLANSAMYSVFSGTVNTVSRAVLLLGTETVGHLALGLKVLDQLQQISPDSQASQDEMRKAVLASQVARACAGDIAGYRDAEEAAVCGMLYGLGRVLVSFYLPQHWALIAHAETRPEESTLAHEWLGTSLENVGRRMAERWGLPRSITQAIDVPDLSGTEVPLGHQAWLTAMAAFSTEAAGVLFSEQPGDAVHELAARYGKALGVEPHQLLNAVRTAHQQAVQDNLVADTSTIHVVAEVVSKPQDALARLRQGVCDLHEAAMTSSAGQLISLALETLHQGFGFSHSFAFALVPQQKKFAARVGFGKDAQRLLSALSFDAGYEPHVFHAALSQNMAVYIENAHAPQLAGKIPRGWQESMGAAQSFLLVPLATQGRPFGLLVGAWEDAAGSVRVTPEEMAPVNEMRAILEAAAMVRRRQMSEQPLKAAA